MKLGSKKGWESGMPLRLKGKSATRFCMFPKVCTAGQTPGNTPVYLNVYDLTPMNGYVYWAGLGVFHSGVEVHGVEYAYGAHDYSTSGVFEVEPRQCPGFKFRKSIFMGTTCLDPIRVREFMELHSANYNGDTYHLIFKNCNHFCNDTCYNLTGNKIPKWVNRLARIGCSCIFEMSVLLAKLHFLLAQGKHDPSISRTCMVLYVTFYYLMHFVFLLYLMSLITKARMLKRGGSEVLSAVCPQYPCDRSNCLSLLSPYIRHGKAAFHRGN